MTYLALENFLSNCSFLVLLLSMVFYWVQAGFLLKTLKYSQHLGSAAISVANLSLFVLLVLRWRESGHFPLSNLYESLMFLSWSFTAIHLILEAKTKQKLLGCITSPIALFTNAFAAFSLPAEMQQSSPLVPALQSNWLMMHVTVMILSYAALICGSLLSVAFLIVTKDFGDQPLELSEPLEVSFSSPISTPNGPRLFSPLLGSEGTEFVHQHTNPNFLGPADLPSPLSPLQGVAGGKEQNVLRTSNSSVAMKMVNQEAVSTSPGEAVGKANPQMLAGSSISPQTQAKVKLAQNLDNLSYRILGLGFPLLTIGILSGAVWANEAWGSYWSWDPKETWALLTWLVFAIYLHTRLTKGWQGKKPAIIASAGFVTVWICFLGVNLIGEGLHSYGWIHS